MSPEQKHHYGPRVHLLNQPLLSTLLAELCAPETKQPRINELVTRIYEGLLSYAINQSFPTQTIERPTRMAQYHPREGIFRGQVLDSETRVVTVNLARAGTLPSAVCYHSLNYLLNPDLIRQDHVSIARQTGALNQVTGSQVSGHKIGGSVQDAIVLIPDPMAATGSTIVETLRLYSQYGKPARVLALHCIVTPEYLKRVATECPELEVFAVRVDRGLSPAPVLQAEPGLHWDQERGLNDQQYIVPGGGGFGEILNNAYDS
jgi:uracil phosphoribosyltransferase